MGLECSDNYSKSNAFFKNVLLIVTLVYCVNLGNCILENPTRQYNILGLFAHPGKSHFDVFEPLLKALVGRGHNVTVISHFPLKEPLQGYRDISLRGPDVPVLVDFLDISLFKGQRYEKYMQMFMLTYFASLSCESGLTANVIQDFMHENNTYDLIIAEMFNTDCFMGVAHKYQGTPLIGISSCTLMNWLNDRFGNPSNPSYIPVNFMDFSDKLSFIDRVENTLMHLWTNIGYHLLSDIPANAIIKKHFQKFFNEDIPPVENIVRNASLMLVNTHYSLQRPRPLSPNVIEVGGIHVGKPKKLPSDIEKWVEESKDGVIVFSFGSMIKGHTFPEDKRKAFQNAFKRLPQRVIWKWENETMIDKPDNVKIVKWLPQLDILCHPNVKAFVAHGGLLGTTEAVHCGVPMVVMPQYGDQHTNARAVQEGGGGVVVNYGTATEEIIYNALLEVLKPSSYEKAKDLSEAFRDRPQSPLETAIYWTEYVARHKGAPRMRSASVDMPFYQYLLLDVIAFLLAIFAILTYVSWKCCRFVYGKCFTKTEKKLKAN